MRIAAAVFALALAYPAVAEQTIVPVVANIVYGSEASYGTSVVVTNLASRPTNVRIAKIYAATWRPACAEPVTRTIDPAETAWIYPPSECRGVLAMVLESDGSIRVHAEMTSGRGDFVTWHYQHIETASEWLPAQRDVILPTLFVTTASSKVRDRWRTNLFLINPNGAPIRVDFHTVRQSQSRPSRHESHMLAPESITVIPLEAILDRWCDAPRPAESLTVAPNCATIHDLTVRADGPFYVSASTVMHGGDALFRSPSVPGTDCAIALHSAVWLTYPDVTPENGGRLWGSIHWL